MKQYRKGEDPVQCTLHCPIIRGFLFCCFPHNLFYFYATYLSFLFSGIFFFHVLFLRCTCVFMIFAPFVTDFDVISFPIFLLFIFFMQILWVSLFSRTVSSTSYVFGNDFCLFIFNLFTVFLVYFHDIFGGFLLFISVRFFSFASYIVSSQMNFLVRDSDLFIFYFCFCIFVLFLSLFFNLHISIFLFFFYSISFLNPFLSFLAFLSLLFFFG